MRAVGLIVEYNPFHNGHKLHLDKSKEITGADVSIAVMSGNFLQRGEPAVINKWKRAEMALLNGVDIVVELPSYYSNQSAEIFAEGSVAILEELGVDRIVFGSESGEINKLENIAKLQLSDEFNSKIKIEMKKGISYPNASDNILKELIGEEGFLSPNNILGLEYMKAAIKKNYRIKFKTIKREKAGFYSKEIVENITSATNIRKYILNNKIDNIKSSVPSESFKILKQEIETEKTVKLEDYYDLIKYYIIRNREKVLDIQDVEVGFENRLYNACLEADNFEQFYEKLISKRYTNSRIRRILTHILLGTKKEFVSNMRKELSYIRILGFSKKGREYMSKIKKEMNLPMVTTFKNITADFDEQQREVVKYEMMVDSIYKMKNPYDEPKKPVVLKR